MSYPVQCIEGIQPEQTARHLCRMAVEAVRDLGFLRRVRRLVRHLVTVNHMPGVARFAELSAIWNWMSTHMRYTYDPYGVELVHGPLAILEQVDHEGVITEDCDGFTVMAMAMLMALGHKCRVLIVALGNHRGFQHVFCEVFVKRVGWIVFDPSLETQRRNNSMLKRISRIKRFSPDDLYPNATPSTEDISR